MIMFLIFFKIIRFSKLILKEKFFMIQDQLNLSSKYSALHLKCYVCKDTNHIVHSCPYLHFVTDPEFVIKKNEFSHPQERGMYPDRRKTKIKRFLFKKLDLHKQIQMLNLNKFTSEIYSSFDSLSSPSLPKSKSDSDEDDDEKEKENEFKLKKTESIEIKIGENLIKKEKNSNESNENIEPFFNDEKNTLNLDKIFKERVNNSEKNLNSSKSNISVNEKKPSNNWSPGEMQKMGENPNFEKGKSINSEIQKSEQEVESFLRFTEDGVDKIFEYKNYFPEFNFSRVKILYENLPKLHWRKRKIEFQRISQYTFYYDALYQELRKKKGKFKNRQTILNSRMLKSDEPSSLLLQSNTKVESRKQFRKLASLLLGKQREQRNSKKSFFGSKFSGKCSKK